MTRRPALLVLVGAGASFGHLRNLPNSNRKFVSPPVTDDLFDGAFADTHPWGWAIVPHANNIHLDLDDLRRSGVRGNFEDLLSLNWESLSGSPVVRARRYLALRIYLQRMFHWMSEQNGGPEGLARSHYRRLSNKLVDRWATAHDAEVIFVSMNYDTILERATLNTGRTLALDDHVTRHCSIIKPHGSVAWTRTYELTTDPTVRFSTDVQLLEQAEPLSRARELPPIADWPLKGAAEGFAVEMPHEGLHHVRLPALALPFQGDEPKERYSNCPTLHHDHLIQRLDDVVATIVIGWSARDEHILRLLGPAQQGGNRLHFVGDDESYRRLAASWSGATSVHVCHKFCEYLDSDDNPLDALLEQVT